MDFAAPKGYVEPARPAPAPVETMASKLKIDLSSSTPGSSRPGSSLGGTIAATAGGDFESFKGLGQTLNGRKTKGKGKSVRKITPADPDSKILRTEWVVSGCSTARSAAYSCIRITPVVAVNQRW